jgi:hypothetical protein
MAAVLALAAAGAVLLPKLLQLSQSPQTDVLVTLKGLEEGGLRESVSGSSAPLVSDRFTLDRVTVEPGPDRASARAVFTLDFEGSVGPVRVSALGLEHVALVHGDHGWRPQGGHWAPTLAATVRLLSERAQALEKGDLAALGGLVAKGDRDKALGSAALAHLLSVRDREYRPTAWYVRAGREGVQVTEEYRLLGSLPERPVDETGRRSLRLVPEGKELRFLASLM